MVPFKWLGYESQMKHEGLFSMMPSKALIKREEEVLVSGSKVGVCRAMHSAHLSLGPLSPSGREASSTFRMYKRLIMWKFPELHHDATRAIHLNVGIINTYIVLPVCQTLF